MCSNSDKLTAPYMTCVCVSVFPEGALSAGGEEASAHGRLLQVRNCSDSSGRSRSQAQHPVGPAAHQPES